MRSSFGRRRTSLQQTLRSDSTIAMQNASSHVPSPSSHWAQVLASLDFNTIVTFIEILYFSC